MKDTQLMLTCLWSVMQHSRRIVAPTEMQPFLTMFRKDQNHCISFRIIQQQQYSSTWTLTDALLYITQGDLWVLDVTVGVFPGLIDKKVYAYMGEALNGYGIITAWNLN